MRNKYNKEGMREELRHALLVVPRTRGQLDGFENNGYSNSNYSRSSYREVTNETGDCITKVKAEVVRTLACKQFKQSPMPLCQQAFKHAKMLRDVHSTQEHVSDWLKYCYSEGAQVPTKALVTFILDSFYQMETTRLAGKTRKLIEHLAHLACTQKRSEIEGNKSRLLSQSRIAEYSGKTQSEWEKRWAKRWKRLLAIIDSFDQEGLDHVYECGRSRKTTTRNADLLVQSVFQTGAREHLAPGMAI
ncbi:bacteriophage antitermination protein Q [Vibrio sp. S4M6]|uniref:bacteriophage antitermination protein Q n=1 Tax=Vibrio sinus TaxID=2946865 RepID=UPI00202A3183|nr:bacteriophage antitermination protein Q [Vibrio sinus]MCL9783641.1 bacteriophage antitermination protein Q [Vibrio sinus]